MTYRHLLLLNSRESKNQPEGWRWLDDLLWDARYAVRQYRQHLWFTVAAVAMLGVGIGVNAAVFTVTNAVLFKGFPGVDPDNRVVYITTAHSNTSYRDFEDWRTEARSFDGMAAVASGGSILKISDRYGASRTYVATQLSANAFRVLRQRPVLGRDFTPSDEAPGAQPVAILSYSLWESRYAKDPAIVGEPLRLSADPFSFIEGGTARVIGVMPDGFDFPHHRVDLWMPLVSRPELEDRESRTLWFAIGRLTDGATIEKARAEMNTIGRQLASAYPVTNQGIVPSVMYFSEFYFGPSATAAYGALLGAVCFVLLIACANLANLLLARAIDRSREMSFRIALGASRSRILRQLLIESLMLSGLGGVLGWWFARVCRLSTLDAGATLKDSGRAATGHRGNRLSALLVVVEVALALVLLVGAGMMMRSFLNVYSRNLGVDTGNILTAFVSWPPAPTTRGAEAQISLVDRLTSELQTVPGVESVAVANNRPGFGVGRGVPYELAGVTPNDERRRPTVPALTIGPTYFRTLGATVLSGREFNDTDGPSGAPVAIVNQRFAHEHWPRQDPLGKRLRLFSGTKRDEWRTVVGTVSNIVQDNAQEFGPLVYVPYRQAPQSTLWVFARARVPPITLQLSFSRTLQALDPITLVTGPETLSETLTFNYYYWSSATYGTLLLLFAGIALLLASIGLYAVVAHAVGRRTQEIGIRIAIGAAAKDISRMIIREGMLPVTIGVVLGLLASLAVNRLLQSQLVGVSPYDPETMAVASVILLAVAGLACQIPARRAIRVDPVVALRHD